MLIQKPYHHPYIPPNSLAVRQPAYVGGELEALTSATPFYRGQGEPIYPPPHQAVRYCSSYGALKDLLGKSAPIYNDPNVGLLQKKLGVSADNDWGPNTTTALKKFQKSKGLPQTGAMDTATLTALQGGGGKTPAQAEAEASGSKWWQTAGTGLASALSAFGQQSQGYVPDQTIVLNQGAPQAQAGMSTGLKVGLAVGGVAVVGLLIAVLAKD